MQHNMGLCCMNGHRGGEGSVTSFLFGACPGKRLENSEKLRRKGQQVDGRLTGSLQNLEFRTEI